MGTVVAQYNKGSCCSGQVLACLHFPVEISPNDLCTSPSPDVDLTVTEASSLDSRGERAELYAHHIDEGLLGGETSYLGPPLTPEKEEALHQATAVANLRAALMSKNSLLSLKADVLGDDGSLLFEYLPKGAHSLSRKCKFWCVPVSCFDLRPRLHPSDPGVTEDEVVAGVCQADRCGLQPPRSSRPFRK